MSAIQDRLIEIVSRDSTGLTESPPLSALLDALAERHAGAVSGILFYGSCLRDGMSPDSIADFYVVVPSYRSAYGSGVAAAANHLLPPNVYYVEASLNDQTYRAKYGVISLSQLNRLVSMSAFHPYFWARFCQPTAILRASDNGTAQVIAKALATAVETMVRRCTDGTSDTATPEDFWTGSFAKTYSTELRSESANRPRVIYRSAESRYVEIFETLQPGAPSDHRAIGPSGWAVRRLVGKLLSLVRLAKSALTFAGGPDYIVWKIERHSGVRYELSDWERSHPILAGPRAAWRIFRRGGFQ